VRVLQEGGIDSPPRERTEAVSGLARVYRNKKAVQIQISIQAARDLGLLDRDQLVFTSDQRGHLTFKRVDGLPIGAEQLVDQAWEADSRRIHQAALRMQCWNAAARLCKRSPGAFAAVYEQLLQEMGLRTPSGRGYSDSHRQKSEQARERRGAKLSQLYEPSVELQPVATKRKPRGKRQFPYAPTTR
jgi:hypothetical protein